MAPLLDLDLVTGGLSSHLITSSANASMDAALLNAVARRTMGALFAPGVRDDVDELTHETDHDLATDAFDRLAGRLQPWTDPNRRRRFLALAERAILSNILWFPLLGHHGERHIVKFAYNEINQSVRSGVVRSLAISLAWAPRVRRLELDHLGDSSSYHVDFSAPEGLATASDPRVWLVLEPDEDPDTTVADTVLDTQRSGQRMHAYVRTDRRAQALVDVPIGLPRHGFLSGAWVAAAGIAFMLCLFWQWSDSVGRDPAASVAILLLVPLLLGYVAVRPVVHPVAVHQVRRLRDLLVISGGLSIFAAIGLVHFEAIGPAGCIDVLFRDVFYVAAAIVALISISWLRAPRAP